MQPPYFINKAFPGSNIYTTEDIPPLDVLAISHDHWDHLDYPTILALKEKVAHIVCPLGVGEYFEQWGFDGSRIHEEDWDAAIGKKQQDLVYDSYTRSYWYIYKIVLTR